MSWQPEAADWPTLKRGPSDADAHIRDLLPAYLNGTITPSEVGRVGDHLERCAGCRAALRSWEAIAGAMRATATSRARTPSGPLDRALSAIGDPVPPPAATDGASPTWLTESLLPDLTANDQVRGERARDHQMTAPGPLAGPTAGPPPFPRAARRRPLMAELSTAAVFVLVLVGVVAALRLAPDDERQVVPSASPSAAPESPPGSIRTLGASEAVGIDECSTEDRPPGTAERLVGTTPAMSGVLPGSSSTETGGAPVDAAGPFDPWAVLAGLPIADQDQLNGIAETIRQLTACRFFYGPLGNGRGWVREKPNGRFFALYSDDFLRRNYRRQDGPTSAPSLIGSLPWLPGGPTPGVVRRAGALPDGRIMTLIQAHPQDQTLQLVVIFAASESGWLIDELVHLDDIGPDAGGTPAATPDRQYLEIGLSNGGATWWTRPSVDAFAARIGVIVTVANLDEEPRRFEIPALGFSLFVEPGQSAEFEVIAPPGRYELASYAADDTDRDDRRLDIELVIADWQIPTRG